MKFTHFDFLICSYESSNHVDTQVPHCPQLLAAHPETAYHVLLSVLFAIMALSTLRCKFLWLPHTTILTAAGISHSTMWKAIGNKLKTSTVTVRQELDQKHYILLCVHVIHLGFRPKLCSAVLLLVLSLQSLFK